MPPRLDTDKVFLTFPQNDTSPDEALKLLVDREGERLEWAVVAQEQHQDGHLHLHALAKMNRRIRCNLDHFDYVGKGKHGNYQPVRYLNKCLAYVIKCGTFIAHGIDPHAYLKERATPGTKTKSTDQVALAMQQGATVADLLTTHPGFVLLHQRCINDFRQLLTTTALSTMPPSSIARLKLSSTGSAGGISWSLHRTMSQEFRHNALWICGPTKTGKSSVLLKLLSTHQGYLMPFNNDHASWRDHAYDFAYCDEFTGQLTVHFLNEWIQGTRMHLNTKGSSVIKDHNLTTIIVSNNTPQQCFPKAAHIDTLLGRLTIIEVPLGSFATEFLDIEYEPFTQEGSQVLGGSSEAETCL